MVVVVVRVEVEKKFSSRTRVLACMRRTWGPTTESCYESGAYLSMR